MSLDIIPRRFGPPAGRQTLNRTVRILPEAYHGRWTWYNVVRHYTAPVRAARREANT